MFLYYIDISRDISYCWRDVNLKKRHAIIPESQSKTKVPIAVPLNDDAVVILRKQLFKHSEFVVTYKGEPIKQCNTKAWKKALARAGI